MNASVASNGAGWYLDKQPTIPLLLWIKSHYWAFYKIAALMCLMWLVSCALMWLIQKMSSSVG